MRGRHFGFLGTLCSVWIAARVGFISLLPNVAAAPKIVDVAIPKMAAAQKMPFVVITAQPAPNRNISQHASALPPRKLKADKLENGDSHSPGQAFVLPAPNLFAAAPSGSVPTFWTAPKQPQKVLRRQSDLNVYAYSFFRSGSQGNVLGASVGQYGGSQSGVIATYSLARFRNISWQSKLALLARGAIAHDSPAEREIAAGLRLQPHPRAPFTLTAERRFRNSRPDASAVYIAGGKSAALPFGFQLDSFAQAGLVSGKDGGAFFDASARAERKIMLAGKTPVTIGAGVWGGGQNDIFRIDAGPTLGTDVMLGETRLRVNADWRFRVSGDARPASGPALTLSTNF